MLEDARSTSSTISSSDRKRLDQYLTSIREVEQRLERSGQQRPDPSRDPSRLMQRPAKEVPFSLREHMGLMVELIAIAFATDQTRVATLMCNNDLSRMDFSFLKAGSVALQNMHTMSHAGGEDYTLMNRFHVELFAALIQRLAGMREGDGTVLDRSCLMFCSSLYTGGAHERWRLPILFAGRAGNKLRTGRTLTFPADESQKNLADLPANRNRRMCNAYTTLARHYGLPIDTFSDSTGPLAGF